MEAIKESNTLDALVLLVNQDKSKYAGSAQSQHHSPSAPGVFHHFYILHVQGDLGFLCVLDNARDSKFFTSVSISSNF